MAVERSRARTEKVSSAMQNFTHSFFVDKLGVDVVYVNLEITYEHFLWLSEVCILQPPLV